MKRPKKIDEYIPVAQAASALRQFADDLDRRAQAGEVVKWSLSLYRWNEAWLDPSTQPEVVPQVVTYQSGV